MSLLDVFPMFLLYFSFSFPLFPPFLTFFSPSAGARLDVDEDAEVVRVFARSSTQLKAIRESILSLAGRLERGSVHQVRVKTVVDTAGCGVEFVEMPGRGEGWIHISELSATWLSSASEAVKVGDVFEAAIKGFDKGRPQMSRKDVGKDHVGVVTSEEEDNGEVVASVTSSVTSSVTTSSVSVSYRERPEKTAEKYEKTEKYERRGVTSQRPARPIGGGDRPRGPRGKHLDDIIAAHTGDGAGRGEKHRSHGHVGKSHVTKGHVKGKVSAVGAAAAEAAAVVESSGNPAWDQLFEDLVKSKEEK